MPTNATLTSLQHATLEYYHQAGRHDLPWRQPMSDGSYDVYAIMVSEMMLQQTQVSRVVPKFCDWMERFPSFQILAKATLAEVLSAWSGLGYNRRAAFLHRSAQRVMQQYGGVLPRDYATLCTFPGVGANTAGAILAYAYDDRITFVETNIRTVFIHHCFSGQAHVTDAMLAPLITESLPSHAVRQWYWALMDYGAHLKKTVGNVSRASSTYTKQSAFEGSRRQLRSRVLRMLLQAPASLADLQKTVTDDRLPAVLKQLQTEGFIQCEGTTYSVCL